MSVEYSFTITLQPKMYKHIAEVQYDLTYLEVYKLLFSLSSQFTCIAELTKNCCIHYHGIIKWKHVSSKKSLIKMFRDKFRAHKSIGHVYIKQIEDLPGWNEYITKDLDETKSLICRPPVINDYFNVLSGIKLDGMTQYDLSDDT